MATADSLLTLTPERIGSGLAGLIIIGLIARGFVKGWIEAKAHSFNVSSNTTAMMGAVSIQFERDQRELLLQTFVRIADALEAQTKFHEVIARSQARLAEVEQNELNHNIAELLEKLRDTERR